MVLACTSRIFLILYVDGMLIVGKFMKDIQCFTEKMRHNFDMKDFKGVNHNLKMDVDHPRENEMENSPILRLLYHQITSLATLPDSVNLLSVPMSADM